jgi:hypothetical protein
MALFERWRGMNRSAGAGAAGILLEVVGLLDDRAAVAAWAGAMKVNEGITAPARSAAIPPPGKTAASAPKRPRVPLATGMQ